MNESTGLLRKICEDPSDTFARLVYADWLDQYGDDADRARAEFIRGQCDYWHLTRHATTLPIPCPDRAFTERIAALYRRERELLQQHNESGRMNCWEWAPKITSNGLEVCLNLNESNGVASVTFRRGFPADITCTLVDWCGRPCEQLSGSLYYSIDLGTADGRVTGNERCWNLSIYSSGEKHGNQIHQ